MKETLKKKILYTGTRVLSALVILSLLPAPNEVVLARTKTEESKEQTLEYPFEDLQDEPWPQDPWETPEDALAEAEESEKDTVQDTETDGLQQEEEEETENLRAPELFQGIDPMKAAYGDPIEVTKYTRVYQVDEKTYKTMISSTPNTYEDEKGKELPIDNTLIEVSKKQSRTNVPGFENRGGVFQVHFPQEIKPGQGIQVAHKGEEMEIYPVKGDYSKPVTLNNAILYNQVYDGIDIQYTVHENGIKEDIILRKETEQNTFSYRIPGNTYEARLNGCEVGLYYPGEEEAAFVLNAPVMTDAAGEQSDEITLGLEKEMDDYILTLTASKEWLLDSGRAYPVKIDPTIFLITSESIKHVTVSSSLGRYDGEGYGYVGYITASDMGVPGFPDLERTRTYYEIDQTVIKKIPRSAAITSAEFGIYQYSNYGNAILSCYKLKDSWNVNTLEWMKAITLEQEIAGKNATSLSGIQKQHEFDVRQTVNDWVQGLSPNYGFVVMATNELEHGGAFFTPASIADYGQPGFLEERKPYLSVTWEVPDPVPDMSLNSTTVKLRTMTQAEKSGKLTLHGVLADGLAKPEATVEYALNDASKNYKGNAEASASYQYPDSSEFDKEFPKGTSRYKDKLSNWQVLRPFKTPALNTLYHIRAQAGKDESTGKSVDSDSFLVYQVRRFDTLPAIAAYYGVPLSRIAADNHVQDMLVMVGNTLFIRNPKKNVKKPYSPPDLTDSEKAKTDALLMGRNKHCAYGFEPINLNCCGQAFL